jgi:hypothetical protein
MTATGKESKAVAASTIGNFLENMVIPRFESIDPQPF